jgi:hypothetical protein
MNGYVQHFDRNIIISPVDRAYLAHLGAKVDNVAGRTGGCPG